MRPIEYIGAAPVKKKKKSSLGGWILVAFALGLGGFFLRPLIPFLRAQTELTSEANVTEAISSLRADGDFGSRLAAAALERTQAKVDFDNVYYQIDFPNGDIALDRGKAEDLVVRAYRGVGIDLQVEVHADIKENFFAYPQIFGAKGPDTNIDHRRVQNLQRFLARKGEVLEVTQEDGDYRFGDLVIWQLPGGSKHIGIVVPGPGAKKSEKWVVHNNRKGPQWEDKLFDYTIKGHFRFGE
jgi:uncharacterized protein YijF (DUF1287 family)